MPRPPTIAISAGFIITGSIAFALTGPILLKNQDLNVPLNVMGINRSPYGEVFAMAMQSPIDDYFHAGTNGHIHNHAPGEDHDHSGHVHDETCDHDHDHADQDHADQDHADQDHDDHVHDEHCNHDHDASPKRNAQSTGPRSLKSRYRAFLVSLTNIRAVRTNPRPASETFKRHLRRQAENKLRFAYHLDPSHYGNYNALHFFLTEPQFGTRPELSPSAATLAQETIDYCLKRTDDPRPALTAAAACTNILHLMFADRTSGSTRFTARDMRQFLQLLDFSIARYQNIAREWETTGQWKALSTQRSEECLERYRFLVKIRNAAEKTILHFEGQPATPQHNN